MAYFLYILFFLSCIVLIISVLLQPGKTDAGALFTSNISTSAFNPRGTASILSKISIVAAIVFMLSALFLSMPALTGNVSVMQTSGDAPTETAPAAISDSNANSAANMPVNIVVDPNAANQNIIITNSAQANTSSANTTNAANQ